jgi:hypothetical protein
MGLGPVVALVERMTECLVLVGGHCGALPGSTNTGDFDEVAVAKKPDLVPVGYQPVDRPAFQLVLRPRACESRGPRP